MNCHVCNRNNAFNLSICPSCGAMINDTVRAELLPKISISKPLPPIETAVKAASGNLNQSPAPTAALIEEPQDETIDKAIENAAAPPVEENHQTGNIAAKPTSPTLVEFHSKKSNVPEWRLQLQNAVRQRQDRESAPTETFSAPAAATAVAARKTKLATSGANALKIEAVQEKKPVARQKNPALSSALERIEKSRQKFYVEEAAETIAEPILPAAAPRPASKNFPFYIAAKQTEIQEKKDEPKRTESAKPALGAAIAAEKNASPRNESGDLDTNKLPPLATVVNQSAAETTTTSPVKISTNFAGTAPQKLLTPQAKIEAKHNVKSVENDSVAAEQPREEADDCAPFALRFNAGLFDLIIGGFLSLVLLAPFMLTGGETGWLSFTGVLAFLATCSIVMFIYLTTTVGFYGRTFGMRLFSLEVVDIEGDNYPTLHQAAVSSAVYLLSLACGGAGFLTLLFNDERRAAHDLASGTIVVKEI